MFHMLLLCLLVNVGCIFGQNDDSISPSQCFTSGDCGDNETCVNLSCQDPCPGTCQGNAKCEVRNHVPYCSCKPGYTGNPFTGCQQAASVLAGDMLGNNSQPRRKRFEVERFIKVNWYAAYAHCRYHGGRLAVIESKEENEQVKEAILKTNLRNEQFWTSGTDFPQGQWVWMTSGKPFSGFSDWEPGEPNNAGDEHCLQFFEKERKGYMWNDKNCMEQIYPICEYIE
uniref:C-type lectin domain-containing protein n=1 Tax=Cuerna arida TaxID=1464854 RepID=A0A1B6FJN9_9HEMI